MQVLIVDSSVQIIERLEEILAEEENINGIVSAVSYEEAIKLFNEKKPDVVLLDCSLPGNASLELLKEIKKESCKTSVIVLSIQEDNYMQEQCKLLGVDFFFDKYYGFEKIARAIKTIAAGKNGANLNI